MGKVRLDNERKDRHNKDLEVEREHRGLVKHKEVAKVGDGVVVRRMTHQCCMQRVKNPYAADLVEGG